MLHKENTEGTKNKAKESNQEGSAGASTYEMINSPTHYNDFSVETWDMMLRIWGKEHFIAFCEINAFKYKMRAGSKPTDSIEQDIKKANWYLNKAHEIRNK